VRVESLRTGDIYDIRTIFYSGISWISGVDCSVEHQFGCARLGPENDSVDFGGYAGDYYGDSVHVRYRNINGEIALMKQ